MFYRSQSVHVFGQQSITDQPGKFSLEVRKYNIILAPTEKYLRNAFIQILVVIYFFLILEFLLAINRGLEKMHRRPIFYVWSEKMRKKEQLSLSHQCDNDK